MSNEPPATADRRTVPENDFELPVEGFQGTPEEIERQWFEQVYTGRGDSMLAVDLAGRDHGLGARRRACR